MTTLVPLAPAITKDPAKVRLHPDVKRIQDSKGLGSNAAALLTLMMKTEVAHPNCYVDLSYSAVRSALDIPHDQFAHLCAALQRRGYIAPGWPTSRAAASTPSSPIDPTPTLEAAMSISLNHHLTRQKAQDDENHRRNREALRRKHEQGLQAILDRPVPPPSVVHSSSGRSAIIPGFFDDASAQAKPEEAPRRKIDKASLHPDVLAKTGNLSLNDNALALFDLLSRAYLAANHSGLVDLSTSEIQRYLGVSEADAQAARAELLFHDLIVFQDSGMGDKGYRPRLKSNLW